MFHGFICSFLLHLLFLLIALFGIPFFQFPQDIEQEQILTLEIAAISDITNMPEMRKIEEKKQDAKPLDSPKAKEEAAELPKKEVEKIPDKKEMPKKEEIKETKKDIKKEEKKDSKKKQVEELDNLLKSIEDKPKAKTDLVGDKEIKSKNFNSELPLSVSEIDVIRGQIAKQWTILAGAKDAEKMSIILRISIEKDGTVTNVAIVDKLKYSTGDRFYKAFVESAIRAVKKSSPLQNLPLDKFDSWKELELNFNPAQMMGL